MKTTQDIIKVVPLDKEFKEDLLKRFDTLTPDQKYGIEQIMWDFYYEVYEVKLKANIEIALEDAKTNGQKLDAGFYERVRKQTEQQLTEENSETEQTVELSQTRDELQKLLKQPQPN